jgi:hypothetical protein
LNGNLIVNQTSVLKGDSYLLSHLIVDGDSYLNSHLIVNNDVSLNNNLFVGGDISLNGKITARTVVFGITPITKYYNWAGSPEASTILTPTVTLNFGNNSYYAKIHCFVTEGANTNKMSSQIIEIQRLPP